MKYFHLLVAMPLLFAACNDDQEPYPPVITEMADASTNDAGLLSSFITDAGKRYTITNTVKGYKANAVYRVVAGYVVEGEERAEIYSLMPVWTLRDSTAIAVRRDPTDIVAAWRGGGYINLQLAPMTHGGTQYWGFSIDSVAGRIHYISLHHNQNGDPMSYTGTMFASLPVDSIAGAEKGDSIFLSITTTTDSKTIKFVY